MFRVLPAVQGSTDTADWPQGVTLAESKSTWCLTSTETTRLIKDWEKGERGMEVGEDGDYIPIATPSPPE